MRDYTDDARTDIFHLAGHVAIRRCADYGIPTPSFAECETAAYRARANLQSVLGGDGARDYCERYGVRAGLQSVLNDEAIAGTAVGYA